MRTQTHSAKVSITKKKSKSYAFISMAKVDALILHQRLFVLFVRCEMKLITTVEKHKSWSTNECG